MTCPSAQLDGAYVLGALAPAERQEYERHLAECEECASAVRALAGLPGLLGRVDAAMVTSPAEDAPPTLLPTLVAEVRRRERRRLLATAGLGAAAAVAVVAGVLVGWGVLAGPDDPASATPVASDMQTIGGAPVRAQVALEDVAWGTRLSLTCTYAGQPGAETGSATYVLVVRTDDGRVERVGTWLALPGRTMEVVAATASRRDDIASVEVRTESGLRLLELTV